MRKIRPAWGVALLAFAVAYSMTRPVSLRRAALRPPHEPDLSRVPPSVALVTVLLGGFRGLAADLLWFRATSLQDEGRFLEIAQLADWITRLEPTLPEVWSYHAWNMAYNISVLFPNPLDRWRWICNGRRILQEDAIRFNPASPRLYAELSWLYYHKIGGYSDPASDHYLAFFFQEVEEVLPGGRMEGIPPAHLSRFLEVFRIGGETARLMTDRWGEMDWRLPETHALYWALEGTQAAGEAPDIRADRLLYLTLMACFFRGRIALPRPGQSPIRGLRPELAGAVLEALEEIALRHPDPAYRWGEIIAYFNKRAAFYLYCYGHDELAELYFERARRAGAATEATLYEMAVRAAEEATMAGADYWDQTMALFYEAARRRLGGDEKGGARCAEMGRRFYEGVRARLVVMGVDSLPSADALRMEGERLACLEKNGEGEGEDP